jgi:hypothetical protein
VVAQVTLQKGREGKAESETEDMQLRKPNKAKGIHQRTKPYKKKP